MLSKCLELNELKHLYKNAANKRCNLYYITQFIKKISITSISTFKE